MKHILLTIAFLFPTQSFSIYCYEDVRPNGEVSKQTTAEFVRTAETFNFNMRMDSTIYDSFVYETKEVEWRWEPCDRHPRHPGPRRDGYCYVRHEYCQPHYILENPRPITQDVTVTIAEKMKLKPNQKEKFHFVYDPRARGLFASGLVVSASSWHHHYSKVRIKPEDLNPNESQPVEMDGLW